MAQTAPASVSATMAAINKACRSRGGVYAGYSCKTVSWDDAARGTIGGALSCLGSNITDTRLLAKDGTTLFTVRSDNWNERLGRVRADQVAVITGNQTYPSQLRPVTLRQALHQIGKHAAYAGMPPDVNLYDPAVDQEVSIRFQTTFLPIEGSDQRAKIEFATQAYNYNTRSDDDPRNLVLLCTSQGMAVQQDGQGEKRLYHHTVEADGTTTNHWLEAERSDFGVGGAQVESEEVAVEAASRSKATASVIGIEAMGTRFNALMTVQVPLQQRPRPASRNSYVSAGGGGFGRGGGRGRGRGRGRGGGGQGGGSVKRKSAALCRQRSSLPKGQSFAARVSRGSSAGRYAGLTVATPRRARQHVTVTVVLYNVVVGGVPTAADVATAVDDMEALYAACPWDGRLGDAGAAFMKSELTAKDMLDIQAKVVSQPPPGFGRVAGGNVFPTDSLS